MGGFVLNTYEPEAEVYIPRSPRVTLTPKGLLLLARLDHITDTLPDIALKTLKDRSKADNFAKGLVCVQAGWLIIQCISRVACDLPVTLLEINTIGHVFCALVMYALWWSKPLDVRDPTVLTGSWARLLCALMCMNSDIYQFSSMDPLSRNKLEKFEMNGLTYYNTQDRIQADLRLHNVNQTGGDRPTIHQDIVPAETGMDESCSICRKFGTGPQHHELHVPYDKRSIDKPTSYNLQQGGPQSIQARNVHRIEEEKHTVQQAIVLQEPFVDESCPICRKFRTGPQHHQLHVRHHSRPKVDQVNKNRYRVRLEFPPDRDGSTRRLDVSTPRDILPLQVCPPSAVVSIRDHHSLSDTGLGPTTKPPIQRVIYQSELRTKVLKVIIRSKRKVASQQYGQVYKLTMEEVQEVVPPDNLHQFKYGRVLEGIAMMTMDLLVTYQPDTVLHLDHISITRWELAAKAMSSYMPGSSIDVVRSLTRSTVVARLDNWPSNIVFDSDSLWNKSAIPIIVLGILTAAYGGLHASAWNGNFPTTMEGNLWKISALVIAGTGVVFALYMIVVECLDFAQAEFKDKFEAFIMIFWVPFLAYVSGRLFLIVEAFISLRALPLAAYDTPSWTQFIPHL